MTTASIQAAFHRFEARLRTFLRGRVESSADVDDLLQNVFVRLIEQRDAIDESALGGWLFSVARRAVIDRYRKNGTAHQPTSNAESWIDPTSETEPDAGAELARCLEPLIERMPTDDAELLRRVDLGGEAQVELARELGVSVSTVKSRVQRARQRLATQLATCCRIELDAAGLPLEYRPKSDFCGKRECAPAPAPSRTIGKD